MPGAVAQLLGVRLRVGVGVRAEAEGWGEGWGVPGAVAQLLGVGHALRVRLLSQHAHLPRRAGQGEG